MSEHKLYPVPDSLADAHISADDYAAMYRRSIDDRDAFFAEMATQFLDWDQPWSEVCSFDFTRGEANWFAGGRLNVSVNCIDRHLPARADQTAIIWEGDDAADIRHISYAGNCTRKSAASATPSARAASAVVTASACICR
jgi:acetyl-CoA synthetase